MADNSFKIVARLDVPASVGAIINDIPKLEKTLRANKEGNVKIVAGLDTTRSTKLIQNQLNAIINQTNAPTIKVGIDVGQNNAVQGIVGGLKEVQNQAQVSTNKLTNLIDKFKQPIKPILNNEGLIDADKTIAKVQQHFQELGKVSVRGIYSDKEAVDSLDKMVVSLKNGQQEARTLTFELDKAGKAFYLTGGTSDNSGIQKFIESTQKLQDKTKALRINLTSDLKSIRSAWQDVNGGKSVKSDENIAKLNQQYIKTAQAIRALHNADTTTMTSMKANADTQIDKLNQMVAQYHNAEKVATQLRAKGFETVKIDTGNNIDKFINSINNSKVPIQAMQTEIDKLTKDFAELDNIQDQAGKSAGLTNILNTLDNAQTKFQSLKELFKGFGNANWLTVNSEQINKISDMATKVAIYKQYLTSTRDEWKTQGIYVGEIQSKMASLARSLPNIKKPEKFDQWVSEWNELNQQANRLKINLDSQVTIQNRIYEIQSQIAKLNPSKDANKIANLNTELQAEQQKLQNLQTQSKVYTNLLSFKEQEKYITEQTVQARKLLNDANAGQADKAIQQRTADMKSYQKQIETAISSLNQLNNSTVFSNNSSNPQVTQTKQEISNLITEYQKLYAQLQANPTSQGLETLRTELTSLDGKMKSTLQSAEAFEKQLKTDNSADQLARRVQVLKTQIEAYASANKKAQKQYGGQFNDMLSILNSNPDKTAVDSVAKQFQNVRYEINKAGLAGKTFFQKMRDDINKFTGWMSMTYAISLFTRSIREAITELKEIDTLLTEISKANDKLTQSQLAEIGSNSFGIASKYGKKASDFLVAVQEMSRAGYPAAEAMGELSTAAQGAGDMTADIANQFIIAADKAYKMNGSVEELTKTLDGINYITNNNAVNMSELSEGFSIVSSTAASFGVDANELTAALGTMSATTQQSGSEVARAFRAILLNIRQVSDEEENINAEGLTKYEKACNALGVSLKEVKDGVLQLRDPMEVLKELSVEYNKLGEGDLRRTELLNSVGGKLRSTQLDALLRQWDMYEDMLQQYEDGNGSMAREAEKTANSLAGAMNRLDNTWTSTIENIVNSDDLTFLVDGLNAVLTGVNNVTKALGTLGTIGLGAGLVAGIKNIGSPKMFGLVLKLPIVICVL